MANEFRHKDVGTNLSQTEWEAIGGHIFNSQATGDIVYASSSTQLTRLAKGAQGVPLIMGASLPQWGGRNLDVGAYDVRGATLTADGLTSGRVVFAGVSGVLSDDADFTFSVNTLTISKISGTTFVGEIQLDVGLKFGANAQRIRVFPGLDNWYFSFMARDNGTGEVEIGRVQGAAEPWFGIGKDNDVVKATYDDKLGFFSTTPVSKPTGVAVSDAGIHAALVTLGLIAGP